MNELVPIEDGNRMLAPLAQTARFGEAITRHHKPAYDDYEIAKDHIHQALGDITDIEVFGRQVLVAVFCRPIVNDRGFFQTVKEIKEDWWQHKAVLILKLGPDAFNGTEAYLNATFGSGVPAPKPNEWLFANASAGLQVNLMGDGASRPQGKDYAGRPIDLFEWEGWPCRIIGDDNFLGRLVKPHSVV
jgi:hypothetical protein